MSEFIYQKDSDGIVTVTMAMQGSVNAMNQSYREAMAATVARLEAESDLTGVVLASAKKVFFAGGDLVELSGAQPGEEAKYFDILDRQIKGPLRRLEKLPVPVVAAINGAALGGGYEICLACNYRIASREAAVQVGLPEVSLGLLPGAGGIVRLVNLLGLETALPYLLEGKKLAAEAALQAGLVDQLVDSAEQLVAAAKRYILTNQGSETAAVQPWDRKGFRLPGGRAGEAQLARLIMLAPAALAKKTRGLLPAPEKILDCAIEAARLDFDTALRIESRALTALLMSPQAKNMIAAFFFQMNKVNRGDSRPDGFETGVVSKLGILGAGMMGQGIALVAAQSGIDVVLKDVTLEAAQKGKAYAERVLSQQRDAGRLSEQQQRQILDRITPCASDELLQGSDFIIEAVFENIELKNRLTASLQDCLVEGGVWGSNTSSLPISLLAKSSARAQNFIGVHFFSPAERMPLVEIIVGEQTSPATVAKTFDFVRQLGKTPIVVNDALGFFTTRTFCTYLDEGCRLLQEGIAPARIDNLGKAVGMPVGPLQLHDETSLELSRKLLSSWAAIGYGERRAQLSAMDSITQTLVEQYGRGGRHWGGGFYDYSPQQERQLWPQLRELYFNPQSLVSDEDIKDRLLFRQVIEALKCLESGVLNSAADGNIGSLLGIGAPTWTGGLIQFVNGYGLSNFIARCEALAAQYGERFSVPAIVLESELAGVAL